VERNSGGKERTSDGWNAEKPELNETVRGR